MGYGYLLISIIRRPVIRLARSPVLPVSLWVVPEKLLFYFINIYIESFFSSAPIALVYLFILALSWHSEHKTCISSQANLISVGDPFNPLSHAVADR